MTTQTRWILLAFAIAGAGVCMFGVLGFVIDMLNNNLPWEHATTARLHYLAVGHSYSQGFAIGFFFCFFLSLAAAGIGSGLRNKNLSAVRSVQTPLHESKG